MRRFRTFFKYFTKNKKAFLKYSGLSFIAGILELFGVALTYPFIIKLLAKEPQAGFFNSPLIIGLSIITLFLVKNALMIFYTYLQAKFTKNIEAELNLSFMKYFLSSSFQESSKVSLAQKENILGFLIPNVINNYILRLLNLNVNFFIFGLITLFLVIKFPIATVITMIFAFVIIGLQNLIFKPRLLKIANSQSNASAMYNQRANEAILNIKSVKVSNNEKFFYENYKTAIFNFFKISRQALFFNTIPPYVTEPFIIILLFVLLSVITIENFSEPEKLVASFAVIVSAIFRLSPTIARIQVNLNGINSVLSMVDEFLALCKKFDIQNVKPLKTPDYYQLQDKIELKNVSFGYTKDKQALKNINLTIKKGEFIGIAGLSGAGKTTLADIIAGLFEPDCGEFLVDGKAQNKPLKIGYIPQELCIINGSIKENVSFGAPEADYNSIVDALKKAQLYDFIIENYKEGIEANPFVDSTGFSQGQKQRLAIARALYSNPDILILDEATSSLDLKTEDEICSVLNSLKGEKTIIAIAHRLSTIKSADRIVFMKNAEIRDIAAFDELISKNKDFKELVELSEITK